MEFADINSTQRSKESKEYEGFNNAAADYSEHKLG
jgi:hypothetical protein